MVTFSAWRWTMVSKIAFIGGTGLYDIEGAAVVGEHYEDTPFGEPSGPVVEVDFGGEKALFLARHGKGHRLLPHEIPFRANVFLLKKLGVEHCVSIGAVGSLQERFAPGEIVIADQLIDFTKSRVTSFFGSPLVGHPSFADPFCPVLSAKVFQILSEASGVKVHQGGVSLCIEGPGLSSRAESEMFRRWGGELIGMTICPEAKLLKEAQISNSSVALVSDYDCWHESEEDVTVEVVLRNLATLTAAVAGTLPKLVKELSTLERTEATCSFFQQCLFGTPEVESEILSVLQR